MLSSLVSAVGEATFQATLGADALEIAMEYEQEKPFAESLSRIAEFMVAKQNLWRALRPVLERIEERRAEIREKLGWLRKGEK